jgi:hypothetical protein
LVVFVIRRVRLVDLRLHFHEQFFELGRLGLLHAEVAAVERVGIVARHAATPHFTGTGRATRDWRTRCAHSAAHGDELV